MAEEMTLELPYPPTVNTYWRHVGRRTLLSRKGREYRTLVTQLCRLTRVETLQGAVAIEMDFYPPDRRRRDLDNLPKSLLDSMAHGGVFLDDSQVVDLHLRKLECCPGGKAVVRVREV